MPSLGNSDAGAMAKATMQKLNLHSPVPAKLKNEILKAADIAEHFIKGNNQMDAALIPEKIIANAKGIAIITYLKAGFLWSGRAGSGLVISRLPNGEWSAPSAIAAASVGFGAQIGASLTDCVFILNNDAAVKAFSHGGNVTLGGQLAVTAGPKGRSAEAAGAVVNLAPIYSYSKCKGLFAGLSLEGSVIITRDDANAKLYGTKVTPTQILTGQIPAPIEAQNLYRVLSYRFSNLGTGTTIHVPYNQSKLAKRSSSEPSTSSKSRTPKIFHNRVGVAGSASAVNQDAAASSIGDLQGRTEKKGDSGYLGSLESLKQQQQGGVGKVVAVATALYDFKGERAEDLTFGKGDRIDVFVMGSVNDWWRGRCNGLEGDFPGNYVSV